ncbi:MAG: glutamate--cysteine ligase [Deltaproteobacteria bacterium HGW-Deltaproteobacteria-14]|jgi:glutamate--cysteine ligase|nr:MAG: glutamate--cysteine ligase [Deltaproteobacteria bacterium HGW-Deltaproteobacteria-14]
MSSHEGSGDVTPIKSIDQLVAHHVRGERSRDGFRVGTEHEKFAYLDPELRPLVYRPADGTPGIRALLGALEDGRGWSPLVDRGEVIALAGPDGSIALEPGGQVEMSGQPRATLHEARDELERHLDHLAHVSEVLPVRWLWMGLQPVHELDAIGWMPKRRYGIMREYLPTRGHLARYMMQATCTVQANLDYGDERDMGRKVRMAMGVSSIVTAMFANSPLKGGVASGYKTFRARIWQDTDPDRTGLLPFAFEGDGATYEQYARWALDVPLFFIMRDGEYLNCAGLPFREFWKNGYRGHQATMEDWETHLSTLFPDVRLKTYLETRTADCVPPDLVLAVPALWKGLFYDDTALDAAWDLVKRWTFAERQQHRVDVARDAMDARVPGGHATADLARELLAAARYGLAAQAQRDGHETEVGYLDPLARYTDRGISPADEIMAWVYANHPSPRQILEHFLV